MYLDLASVAALFRVVLSSSASDEKVNRKFATRFLRRASVEPVELRGQGS
jgi:hypothetical protein